MRSEEVRGYSTVRLVLAAVFFVLVTGMAMAQDRLALVVGNAKYTGVQSLKNPVSDAELIASSLEAAGFDVTLIVDADQIRMTQAVANFGRSLRNAGPDATGLFYFAGHGVQSFGRNYLLPVDTELSDPADLDFAALEAQSVLRQMSSARNRTNIVILDACRNNPFDDIPEFGESGLAEMKAPTGTFLAYATGPNEVAFDGEGENSPFTASLAQEITVPGRTIEDVFRAVRIDVLDQTAGAQTTWDTSSLTIEFEFLETEPEDPAVVAAKQLWDSVKATNDPVQVMLYLRGYPESPFTAEARTMLTQLLESELHVSEQDDTAAPQMSSVEEAMIARAQASGDVGDYAAYLERFPQGVFAELARSEIATQAASEPESAENIDASDVAPEQALTAEVVAKPDAEIGFATPLVSELPTFKGLSIANLIEGSPIYAPIDGLPEELWKGQSCSNCHAWTRDALCDQGNVYRSDTAAAYLQKLHPYGGGFKTALRNWSDNDCQ
ncbi:MAG: caspase family protein [Pseudomonadota bacterium]